MRSESDGHCAPTSFPGLAVREATRRRDPVPLVRSVFDRYRPTVDEFLRHVAELRERSRWDDSVALDRIDRIAAVDGGFAVGRHGDFRHVLVATGHPGLAVPAELAGDPRVVHAYEPHEYASRVDRRRRRHGGGDRMAERARRRLRGRLGAAARAGQAAAQRRPAVLHASAASPASTPLRARGARRSCTASGSRRTRRAGPGTRRSRRPSARAASASPRRSTAPSR